MYKYAVLLLTAVCGLVAAPPPAAEPVYIVLYSRFYDHGHQHTTNERIERLLPILTKLQKQHPDSGISALFQFSGTVSELMAEENPIRHVVDELKDYSNRKLIDIGYTGEDEPSYLYRPKPNLLLANTPEENWTAKAEAAAKFLNDFKNPVTGLPVPGLTGGVKRTQEVFGKLAFISGVSVPLGGDSAVTYEIQRLNPELVMPGIPVPNSKYGIEGFGFSAENFSKFMSPETTESPELFWEDNVLRLSDSSLNDNRPHSTDEDLDSLKKVFAKLDRSHIRVIKLEVAAYKRYLTRRADGSVVLDPMEWMYYHPDEPKMPPNMKPLVPQGDVEAGYRRDEATLNWLLNEYLPANPGSRFVSVRELSSLLAATPRQVSVEQLKALAADVDGQYAKMPMTAPDFARAGDCFFSLAESFNLFAQALAGTQKASSLPGSIISTPVYGPLTIPNDMGPITGSIPVSDVIKAAHQIAPKLAETGWKRIPDNAVPAFVQVGQVRVNASQFLHLMAQAYLDPTPDRILKINASTLTTRAAFMFPKNTLMTEQGNAWTFKPAPLKVTSASGSPAASASGQ